MTSGIIKKTVFMIPFDQGDIILIPFPFTDFSTFKQRPAVVFSSASFNNSHDDIIAMAITSQIPKIISNDEFLLNKEEVRLANLPKPSLVKIGKITTINKILIRKKLGTLPDSTIEKLKSLFFKII